MAGLNQAKVPVCFIHNEPEPDLPGDYRSCGECWHVFRTEDELRGAYTSLTGNTPPVLSEHIYACPLCAHDF